MTKLSDLLNDIDEPKKSMSLMTLMNNDEFGARLKQKIIEVKQDKQNIMSAASSYAELYKEEIAEGTKLKQKLISEGKAKGLKEDEVIGQYGRFVPAIQTPILNWLYFILRESEDKNSDFYKKFYGKRDKINQVLIETHQVNRAETDKEDPDITSEQLNELLDELSLKEYFDSGSHDERKELNKMFMEEKSVMPEEEKVELKEVEDIGEFLYGNLTLSEFDTLKKLKSLAEGSEGPESVMAFTKAKELCKKHGLEYSKIPSYKKKK